MLCVSMRRDRATQNHLLNIKIQQNEWKETKEIQRAHSAPDNENG